MNSETSKIQVEPTDPDLNKSRKNPKVAFWLTVFLGAFGAHHFYLGRKGLGFTYLLLCWTFVPLIFSLIELSTIRSEVAKYNAS
jgi:TM2 domain-containing membrane protein YozV